MATTSPKVIGYLPNDAPPFGRMLLLGFQHVLTMFPATVLCALLMNFDVSTVLTITGLGTVVALIGSKLALGTYIPLYYGSSFSYIAAVAGVIAALSKEQGVQLGFGQPAPAEMISVVQTGFLATGLINVIVGLIIRIAGGKEAIDRILPPVVTGSVACTIGIGLGKAALDMSAGTCCGVADPKITLLWWLVAVVTLVAAFLLSVLLQNKGFIGMLPILLAAIVGYIFTIIVEAIAGVPLGATPVIGQLGHILDGGWLTVPRITFPTFASAYTATVIVSVGIMAIATIPESTAHLYQISLYVDHLAQELGKEPLRLNKQIGLNLMLDGLNDMVNGLFGSTAGTNYGENNSLMVITRNYSGPVLITAGVIAIILGFIAPLKAIVQTLPTAVSGGLSIYLFGVIGMQGIALMMAEKVNLFDPKELAIGATILIIGIGGNIGFATGLPIPLLQGVFPGGWPAIATGAVVGILMNLFFVFVKAPEVRAAVEKQD